MKKEFLGEVDWFSLTQNLVNERVLLLCFGEKCMSCRVSNVKNIGENRFIFNVEFIEPNYFENELKQKLRFTLRESSIVLGEGKIV